MAVRVVNKKKEAFTVYIGRGSIWGNPYKIDRYNTREMVINRYKEHLYNQISSGEITKEQLIALDGETLGCFCKPAKCHGDVIARAVMWAMSTINNGL